MPYTIRVICTNCGMSQVVDIPLGQEVEDTECPNCGCYTLLKNE